MNMKIPRIAFVLFLAFLPVSAQNTRDSRQLQSMDAIRALIKGETVVKVRIIHVPDSTETFGSVSPDTLRSLASIDKTFNDRIGERFGPLFSGVSAKKLEHKPDLRWGVLFYDAKGQELASLFVDKFGEYGYINNQTVLFETGTFARNLAKRLHRITGVRD